MREPLKKLVESGVKEPLPELAMSMKASRDRMNHFLVLVPSDEIAKIDSWVKALKAADVNKYGVLDPEETKGVNQEYQDLYRKVGDFLGG